MKPSSLIAASALLLFLFAAATINRSSSGAPASHTGAPGEQTCAAAGCHDDNRVNRGSAKISLDISGDATSADSGRTYDVKVRIVDAHVKRFGFQLVALDARTDSVAGHFVITDSLRTQIVTNMYKLKDRSYVTYTFAGTDAIKDGIGEWTMKWKAPVRPSNDVTFYLAAVSANDDMSDKGDKVYTGRYSLSSAMLK